MEIPTYPDGGGVILMDLAPAEVALIRDYRSARETSDTERPPPPARSDRPISEWAVMGDSVRQVLRFPNGEERELWHREEDLRAEICELEDVLKDLVTLNATVPT